MSEPIPTTYHFSLGSAATGVHVSVDIDANDTADPDAAPLSSLTAEGDEQ